MKPLLLWLLLAQGGDLATTLVAVHHQGCAEGNPLLAPHLPALLTVKAALTVGLVVSVPLMHRAHPRMAVATALIPALSGTVTTGWNLHQLARGCR